MVLEEYLLAQKQLFRTGIYENQSRKSLLDRKEKYVVRGQIKIC